MSLVTMFGRTVAAVGIALAVSAVPAQAVTPVPMASNLSYTENFADIANWTDGFAAGIGANRFASVGTGAGTIPGATAVTTATATFASGSTGGVQRGTGTIQLLSTGTTDNSSSTAIDFFMDFTGTTAGNLSYNWAEVNNSTGDRVGTVRVYASTDGANWSELTGAAVSVTNNVASSGTVNVALPASFNNTSGARLRFYYHNGSGGTTGSRPKFSIDNLNVTATLLTYTLTASAGANGGIAPSGVTTVNSGASQGYTITPNTGYHVADVLVDGSSVGAVTSYTFSNVTANHTISASFAINTYTITASAGANGSIAPAGVTTLNFGDNQAYTITPNAGYVVQDVLVDGGSVGAVTSYPFTSVSASHTISASFVVDPSIATVSAVSPGTFVTTTSNATVPVTLARGVTTPILGYSVTLQLSGLTTTSGAISEGGFLSASGATTSFHVVDNGGGSYTVDGVTLGTPCGSSATSGTLFSLAVGSALTSGTGTVTITSVTLRDCSNATLGSSIGSAASVSIDRSTPGVAVTSPNGGESWLAGSSHAITWTATDAEGIAANSITLEYSVNSGSSWLPVASGLANSGTFSWTVPSNPSTTALVRATAVDIHGNTGTDASDATFTLQGTSSTVLTSSPNPSVVGESATLTATVTPASATGTVEFFDGATSLGTAPISGGTAALLTTALPVGSRSLTAVYSGSALEAGSTSAAHGHTVNQAATSTALNSSPDPSVVGESVALTATVSVTPPGAGSPGGSVEFFDGATSLGTSPVVSGSAVLNTAALPVGARSLTAVYSGDASFSGSTSPAHGHTVNAASTATALNSSPNPSVVGESVALTATVSVNPPGAGTPGGSVEFFDGATSLGTSPVSGGAAVLNTAALPVGARSLTAVYSGNASFSGSTSPAHAHTVNQASTTTAVSTSPNPSVVGESVAITGTVSVVSPGAGGPGGSIEFFDGATSLGTAPVSAGSASINTSSLALGAHSLTAVYSGDASFTGSTSPAHSHTVNQASTATALASAPNPSTFGSSVALTATVSVNPPGSGTPAGTVEFFDGATSLGTSPVSTGSAVMNTSTLSAGVHSLTAVYSGDAGFTGSTSPAHSHTVNAASSSTAVTSSPNPSVVGESVALTATVTPASATGSVEFFDGATSLGTSPVSAGSASLNTAALAVGAHSITAVYSGDASYGGSTSPTHTHTVNPASTSTALDTSPNPSVVGESISLSATVSVSPPGSGAPGGSIEFFDGATSLGTAPVSGGSASINTAALAVGGHSLTAVYSGNASFSGSTSSAHSHTVNPASTTTALASAPDPSTFGTSVTLTATVTVAAPGAGSPGGSIEFFDGATSLGTAPVSSGSAVLNTSSLAVGSHSLTAVYAGNPSFTGSTSPVHMHTVSSASSTTAVTSAPNPSLAGESVTLTATVTPPAATGTVEFFDGATSLGSSPLSGGTATKSTSALALGSHSITAVYSGDLTYTGSTSPAHSHTVNQASTSTALTSAPNPSTFGASVALTATVTVVPPGAGNPGGSVEFFDGATSLGTAPVSSGSAVLNTSSLGAGVHSLTAVYSGDASFTGSTSPAHSHTVNTASSSTSLASSPNPSTFGQSVTFTATVAPSGATGSVEFFDGATSLGTSPVSSGSAQLSTSALATGSHSITAVYSGNSSYSGSTSNLVTQVVNAASSSVTLVAAPDPGVYQSAVTLTATVTPSGATGSIEFFDGSTSLGTAPVSAGTATLSTSALTVGTHSLTAHYSGDASYSGATSTAYSLEVKAKIVATAGPNGSLSPLGTTLYSLNATPSYTFAADPGYHVASVTVDGGAAPLTSPYTFAALSSNHTIDVQFAVNPTVPAITTLAATQVRNGNDSDGNTAITLSWTAVPAGSTVEVWRKGFGNYPEYDDGPTPGSVPSTPGAYPPAGWTLTTVHSPGDTDEPGSRDFWYYVAYVTDTYGTRSPVSNQTTGTLDYHLGDVSNGTTPGVGDNQVTTSDLSVLGAHYGISGAAVDAVNYLDVGPTTDLSVNARPTTDDKIDFEDLVVFAINYYPVASAPQAHAAPAASSQDALALTAPSGVRAGDDVAVRVSFTGTGHVLAMSAHLAWDPAVVQPASFTAGDAALEQGALLFSAAPGSVDGAVFTGSGHGFTGDGEFATLHFHVVAAGDPKFGFASTDARDGQNHKVALVTGVTEVSPKTFVTAFAPAMPNPFGKSTTFAFSLAKAGRADLEVYSVDGRRVRTITSGSRDAGEYRLEWNGVDDAGRPIAPGVYYARLVTAQGRFTRVVTRLE